mmetsp:Transcript_146333/g.272445  ORF Transcript_146333/g.272445 Transcript_146333/m.272445 type:complete len:115 (-) Transcript_146333:325-669(-)
MSSRSQCTCSKVLLGLLLVLMPVISEGEEAQTCGNTQMCAEDYCCDFGKCFSVSEKGGDSGGACGKQKKTGIIIACVSGGVGVALLLGIAGYFAFKRWCARPVQPAPEIQTLPK